MGDNEFVKLVCCGCSCSIMSVLVKIVDFGVVDLWDFGEVCFVELVVYEEYGCCNFVKFCFFVWVILGGF